uniref:AlNc14C1818G13075 protein n=1 Tax=Albugo laibachii Nc14 TaxID=890382 RepID=F0X2U5_9STRA|nr:AlNc14C1818G13075 [Albugo laibachii Nc14]|eukprot:CCA28259.1 AlNc14C1818G13075 [Albugo laibachii Nc14]
MELFFEFEEMCMKMQDSGESMNLDDQLIILIESLSDDYDIIVKIIVNSQGMGLFSAKEILLREYQGMIRKGNKGDGKFWCANSKSDETFWCAKVKSDATSMGTRKLNVGRTKKRVHSTVIQDQTAVGY